MTDETDFPTPDNLADYPKRIEDLTRKLRSVTDALSRQKRKRRKLRVEKKLEAKENNTLSNSTERKHWTIRQLEMSDEYIRLERAIEEKKKEQAKIRGRLRRLILEVKLAISNDLSMPDLPFSLEYGLQVQSND